MPEHMPRCACGRWVSIAKPYGWFKHGEHGSEEGWVCARCVKAWVPKDGRGRGPEAGYCGVVNPEAGYCGVVHPEAGYCGVVNPDA